jgi:hypothetical protein
MGKLSERMMTALLGLYISIMSLRARILDGYNSRARRLAKRVSETGGFFSENFLYLAVFSIPVAFLFFLLARKYIWPYAEDNIFPCFSGNGEDCFADFGDDSFSDSGR